LTQKLPFNVPIDVPGFGHLFISTGRRSITDLIGTPAD